MIPIAGLMAALSHPLVRRIVAFVVHRRDIRAAFVAEAAKLKAENPTGLAELPNDEAAIERLLDEVAAGIVENEALQAEIRAGLNAIPPATRLD